jgi:hypothetical protein
VCVHIDIWCGAGLGEIAVSGGDSPVFKELTHRAVGRGESVIITLIARAQTIAAVTGAIPPVPHTPAAVCSRDSDGTDV